MDIPLQFHEFYPLNHVDKCPKYTETLQRVEVQQGDLDALYTDLENLQGAANIRLRRLEDEVKILSEWCDKKERSKTDVDLNFLSATTNVKRARTCQSEESKVLKKQRVEEQPSKATLSKSRSKCKVDNSDSEVSVSKPKITYEAPNKFWSYVEPYCSDILPDHIAALEDSLTSKADASEYFKVPPLGKHYSEVWSKEDFIEEQQQSAKIDKKRTLPLSNAELIDSQRLLSDVHCTSTEVEDACQYGTFTQRLIAALVDENIMAPVCESDLHDARRTEDTKSDVKLKKGSSHSKSLEMAIKEELFSLGLIDSVHDEDSDCDTDDEILNELRKLQSELKAVRSYNKQSVNKLVARAKNAMRKQEIRQKAKILDAEVVDIFRRFTSAKNKKKGLSRKDRELAWKAYNERKAIWELVDNNELNGKIDDNYL